MNSLRTDGLAVSPAAGARAWVVPCAILLAIFVGLYFFELASFSISVDDEQAAIRTDPAVWIAQGRWAVYLVELALVPQPVVPFLPGILLGAGLSVAYYAFVRAMGAPTFGLRHYALFPFFAAFPTWLFVLEFYGNLPGLAGGTALVGLAVFLFAAPLQQGPAWQPRALVSRQALLIALALGCALGFYQSLVLLFIAACAGVVLAALMAGRIGPRGALVGLAAIVVFAVAGTAIYYGVWQLFLLGFDVEPTYIDAFYNPGLFFEQPLDVIGRALDEAWLVYTGSERIFGIRAPAIGVLMAAGLVTVLVSLARRGVATFAIGFLLVAIVIAAPFGLNILSGAAVPYRSLVAAPFAVWFAAWAVGGWTLPVLRWARYVVLGAGLLALLNAIGLFQAGNDIGRDFDRAVARALYERIVEVNPGFESSRFYGVTIAGALPIQSIYPEFWSSIAGHSLFSHDGGNPYRIVAYMRVLGYANLLVVPQADLSGVEDVLATMPAWPDPESVRLFGETTVVKLSP